MWPRDEESEPLDYAAELDSRTAGRLVLADRQTEGAGVSPGGPMAEGMRTDAQPETLDGTAGLVGSLPTGRDRDEHGHGEGIARQGEHLDRRRHRLQVDYLGPAGNDHQVGRAAWFNGGLFDDGAVLPLEKSDIETVLAASDLDWSEIDPSILGTLFERGLDPGKRAQLGAHYTDRDKIMLLVEPVVICVQPGPGSWLVRKRWHSAAEPAGFQQMAA